MASVARQPFAPLDNSRLQNLTSIKNRQNARTSKSSAKRKASLIEDIDDFENVDPGHALKRSKGLKGLSSLFPSKEVYKSAITLNSKAETRAPVAPTPLATILTPPLSTPVIPSTKHIASSLRRSVPTAKSSSKLSTTSGITKSSTSSLLSAPAGRSPPRSKRVGLLSSRLYAVANPYSRIDPSTLPVPVAPLSLDAALKGSIPSYAARSKTPVLSTRKKVVCASPSDLSVSSMNDSWFFAIHEDTPEQEMTNLLQHSTCTLDISSDEETENKQHHERDEGTDKENVPPSDDVSQLSQQRWTASADFAQTENENTMLDKAKLDARVALREMNTRDFFADGCDERSIFVVPGDEDAETVVDETEQHELEQCDSKDFVVYAENVPLPEDDENLQEPTIEDDNLNIVPSIDELMRRDDTCTGAKAAVLEPVEGTRDGGSFEVWESGSAKDENEEEYLREISPAPVENYCEFSQTAASLEFL